MLVQAIHSYESWRHNQPERTRFASGTSSSITRTTATQSGFLQRYNPPRHELLNNVTSTAAAVASWFPLRRIGAMALTPLLGPVAPVVAPFVGVAMAYETGKFLNRQVRTLRDSLLAVHHLHMGGDYYDTNTALGLRQRALEEMGSAVGNARHYLGRESVFLR